MGCRTRDSGSTLRKETRIPFRFHPNSTSAPSEIPTYGGYGSPEVLSVTREGTGLFLLTLVSKHEQLVSAHATYHLASGPAENNSVHFYGKVDGTSADNVIYLQLYVAGAANDPTYAATTFICGELVYEEILP